MNPVADILPLPVVHAAIVVAPKPSDRIKALIELNQNLAKELTAKKPTVEEAAAFREKVTYKKTKGSPLRFPSVE